MELIVTILTFAGFFLWSRAEARSDMRHLDNRLESNRNLCVEMIKENRAETQVNVKAIQKETRELVNAIRDETKDFHGRLCAIEERRKL